MKKQHLPLIGVGPIYVVGILLLTLSGIFLDYRGYINHGKMNLLRIPLICIGLSLIIFGIYIWLKAVIYSKIDDNIKKNKLVIDGVYSNVRNPIYSAFAIFFSGILFLTYNLYLMILPIIFWIYMTVLMKFTEEKWLEKLYGDEYMEYCKKVNRCIPWFKRRKI